MSVRHRGQPQAGRVGPRADPSAGGRVTDDIEQSREGRTRRCDLLQPAGIVEVPLAKRDPP